MYEEFIFLKHTLFQRLLSVLKKGKITSSWLEIIVLKLASIVGPVNSIHILDTL